MNTLGRAREPSWALLGLILLGAVALRAPHLVGPIDEPHAWRQAETAEYARAFFQDGLDLLHPSVCWLGPHKTLALECPLPEAVTAIAYGAIGAENLMVARLITLACFLGAAVYLFLLVRLLFDSATALVAAAVFLALPLGLYYSRAVHVDPAALLCVHAAVFHAVRGYEEGRAGDFLAATLWAVPACLVKAPYAFYFAIPLGVWIAMHFNARRAAALVLAALPAIAAFLAWRHHAAAVNAHVPDWSFIPHFQADLSKHEGGGGGAWYFGSLESRWDPGAWTVLGRRLRGSVAGPVGLSLVALGLLMAPISARRYGVRPILFVWGWALGVVAYVLVFFNLNVIHDYYQLPLLAAVAVVSAVGLATLREEWTGVLGDASWLGVAGALALLTLYAVHAAQARYYHLDLPRMEAGAIAQVRTPPDALLVTAISRGNRTDDPRLLYRAGRYGWSIAPADLNPGLVARLEGLGATHALVVLDGPIPPALTALARANPMREYRLSVSPWRALLFDLRARSRR